MEPENRPYVNAGTEPGDAGTEEWADTTPGSADAAGRGPLAAPTSTTDDEGVVDGSPADTFINDADTVSAQKDEDDGK